MVRARKKKKYCCCLLFVVCCLLFVVCCVALYPIYSHLSYVYYMHSCFSMDTPPSCFGIFFWGSFFFFFLVFVFLPHATTHAHTHTHTRTRTHALVAKYYKNLNIECFYPNVIISFYVHHPKQHYHVMNLFFFHNKLLLA